MKKRTFLAALSFLILIISPLQAADGLLWGEVRIRVFNTKWFEIIYPEESEESAALLAENADNIYEEIAQMYGREPAVKLPVVLCPSTEQYNAYFSSAPYNRIVLYDTAIDSDMAVFSDDLLSTFRHELTHAYTYNLKSGFWFWMGTVFGDCISPASFMVSPGWAEGATMTSEASSGEGRLNSEYAMHMVKQAKIENQFPYYADVQGASDKYPGGSYYYFNGAFDQWLQNKYGMEKYAEFWYRIVNWKSLTPSLAFKKIYGCSIKEAWSDFEKAVAVPAIPENPLTNPALADYFSGDSSVWSPENLSGAIYSSLCKSADGTAYIERKSGSIFYGGKKIGAVSGADNISFSKDGRFMAVSYTDSSTPTYTRKIRIYDTGNRDWIKVEGAGLSDGTIIQSGGSYYLVALGFKSQKKWIEIRELQLSENRIKGTDLFGKIEMENNEMPISFTGLGEADGRFAYIRKQGLEYSLCLGNLHGEDFTEYALPYEKMTVKDISFSEISNSVYFSWTVPGSMPLLGKLDLNSENYVLYEDEFSGGVFSPVETAAGEITFEGHFYRQNRLLSLKEDLLSGRSESSAEKSVYSRTAKVDGKKNALQVLDGSKPYSPWSYMDGVFIPASVLVSRNRDVYDQLNCGKLTSCFLGATYLNSNPWGTRILEISGGYDPFSGTMGALAGVSGGTDTDLFKWTLTGQVEADKAGFSQGITDFSTSLNIALAKGIRLGLSEQLTAGIVRIHSLEKNMKILGNTSEAWLTNVHKSGPGYFEYSGLTVGTKVKYQLVSLDKISSEGPMVSPFMNIYIPKLIPVSCRDFYTYNLPLTLKTEFFSEKTYLAGGTADICLFGMDIQKSVPFLRVLYLNRIYLNSGYSGLLADKTRTVRFENTDYYDCIYLKATAGLSPSYYSGMYSEFTCQFEYYLRKPSEKTPKCLFSFGFSINGL